MSTAAHHIRLPDEHVGGPILPAVNGWLDTLRERGELGRLLAARGNLEALLRSLCLGQVAPRCVKDLTPRVFADFLAGHGPIALFRGSWYFATDAGRLLSLWARHVDSSAALASGGGALSEAVGAARAQVEGPMIRTMEAFEHLAWDHFGGVRATGRSRAAGWFEVEAAEAETVSVRGVRGQVAPALEAPLAVRVPEGARRRLEPGDLLWMDLGEEPAAAPLAVGTVCCSAARDYLGVRGWPCARTCTLPPDVRARFTGRAAAPTAPDGALEQ